jgi:hypothetical protein
MFGFSEPAALVTLQSSQAQASFGSSWMETLTDELLDSQLFHYAYRISYGGERMPFIWMELAGARGLARTDKIADDNKVEDSPFPALLLLVRFVLHHRPTRMQAYSCVLALRI